MSAPAMNETSQLDVRAERAGHARLRLSGGITIATEQQLRHDMLATLAQCSTLELALEDIDEVDGAGVQLLVALRAEAARLGLALTVAGRSAAVDEALALCGLDALFSAPLPAGAPA